MSTDRTACTRTTIATTPAQALTGTPIGGRTHAQCSTCLQTLGEGSTVALRAHCLSDETRWTVAAIHCQSCICDHGTITTPTAGAHECVLTGRLATRSDVACQTHRLVFLADTDQEALLDFSGADDGHPPDTTATDGGQCR